MAIQFNIPASPTKHVYASDRFLGADFTSEASNVDDTKSPNVVNMIRSVPGKIRKRMGYKEIIDYGAPIYGVHHLTITDVWLVHAGTKLYSFTAAKGKEWVRDHIDKDHIVDDSGNHIIFLTGDVEDTLVYEGMAEHKSVSFQLNQKLVILDGQKIKIFDGETVQNVEDVAYIPTLTISKDPNGGGQDNMPLNLLQPAFIEEFYVAWTRADPNYNPASVKNFQLTFGDLDDTEVLAWVMDSNGEFQRKNEGTDFTVNRTTGVVTFINAPGKSPIEGHDNVRIQAYRTVEGYADRINHCTIGALFGVNGANDRLFVSGNPDQGIDEDGKLFTYINCDWFSQQYDPTYFADVWYSKLGSDTSAIMGYSIINNYLAAHKDFNETSQSILIREGDLVDDEPVFKLINTLQGSGAISKYCFNYLATEPVFLSRLGIYAVTAQDITGEKYAQDRSYYLEGRLLKEENLKDAFAYSWRDFYILCVNSHCYILDGLQPLHTDKSRPYSTRQYAGFYFTNIPASCFFEVGNELLFGSHDGKIYKFYTDDKEILSYNDNGEAINAIWETVDISEDKFYKNKTYRYVAVRCMPEIVSSLKIEAQKNGLWQQVKLDETTFKYFSFSHIIFSKFSFSTNGTQRVSASKMRIKKVDHIRFRFSNDCLNEPLGINDFAVEYVQNSNIK